MSPLLRRRGTTSFQRAADGSMTLIEHIRELRSRLFKASLAVLVGFGVGFWLAGPVLDILRRPYCELPKSRDPLTGVCNFVQLGVADVFLLQLKIALWIGLIVAAPIWLYQLWAFIAPGLHRHERRWAYIFAGMAAPLFTAGAFLAFFVVQKGLQFLLQFTSEDVKTTLEITRYVSFVTTLIILFGVAFLFPLVILLLNVTGMASARRLLGWWRTVVFVFFAFSAVVTPTPDPFGMTALALCLSAMYFIVVGVAFLLDRRKRRRGSMYTGLADDEISPLDRGPGSDGEAEPLEPVTPVDAATPVGGPAPLDRRYDETT